MGIRVVQRALPPPSPRHFNLTGPSVFSTTKDRTNKQRNKSPFTCKFGQAEFKTPMAAAAAEERRTSLFQQQATIEEHEPTLSINNENRKPNNDNEQDNVVEEQNRHNQCEIHLNGDGSKCLNEHQMESSEHEVKFVIYILSA